VLISVLESLKRLLSIGEEKSLYIRALKDADIRSVLEIERQMYTYPWSEEIFRDCLKVGYSNWALIKDDSFIGFAILSIAAGEAHILNICLDPTYKRQGLGKAFLDELFIVAKKKKVDCIFLEVRPSNIAAVNLYKKIGFKQIGQRKNYYPAESGREDAIVFSFDIPAET